MKAKTSIVFTGDIGFDRYMDQKWTDENLLSQGVLDFFHSADHVCLNVEGAVVGANDAAGEFVHSMDPAVVRPFQKMGADIWSIGNNHIMDAGEAGVASTMQIAKEQGSGTFGAGRNLAEASQPLYIDEAGGIGIIGVSYMVGCVPATETTAGVLRWDDLETIQKRIDEIKAKCRWCVVAAHGGEEFSAMPLPYTRDKYMQYLQMGADVVVGHHPHVPENYEQFPDGKIIFYSLGNFIFDTNYQRVHLYTDLGVLLKLTFTEEKMDFDAMGIRIVRGDERIVKAELPDVFTNVPAEEYELLAPLSAHAFVVEDARKMIYLEPETYTNATEETWHSYFFSENTDGFFAGAHMDFNVVLPFSRKWEEGLWKQSKLEKVKNYILRQLEE